MTDMLVKLYALPALEPHLARQRDAGIDIRRALPPEKHVVAAWVRKHFEMLWVSECEVAITNKPVSCLIAVQDQTLLGFACYDATCKDFFGPIGVAEPARGKGIGMALLLACLHAMAGVGYAYAIIPAGPTEFYAKTVDAIVIPDSVPGFYKGMLREP